ncbi:PREDICTED: protein Lines homolog [Fulmarus glacialis]|uniref:Protein Lines n=1 Tax=Fulmarus glacialis TaxID=30455 RepID=A0A093J7D1_FULGA|nr:PREDICTED: protein Lines homolog [Fulmarus glacialis]KFW07812.1 Protein Lines [Fulmarus glacialis]
MKISLLQQMYKDVLVGIPLAKESHHYTSLLNLCVEQSPERDESCNRMHLPSTNGGIRSRQDQDTDMSDVPTTDDTSNSFGSMNSSFCPREVMLLQLTLIKMMVAKAQSQEIEFNMRQKYCEIFVLLLKEAKIDSKLICLLGSYDQLLSHMASKSLASLVYFQLKEENTLNVTWLTFSLKTLSGFPVNTHVAECLWTLTSIIKDILKDKVLSKAGILKKLLAPLDAVLEGFYNSILFHHFDSHHYTSPYSEAANNLISFIDLLEALLASRIELELPLRCQRVLFLKVSYVLNLISSSIHYLIKKLFIMLLKKCILCKSESGSLFLQNPSLYEDMLALSSAILQVVNLTWLNEIPLSGKASYFGGSEAPPGDDTQGGSDQTVLRALSLVVLKALEFKFQNSATEAEIKGDFQSFMSQLLIFWRSHLKSSPQSHPVVHHCEWLSLIFIEQDDDMWEAAKALLLIYLKFDRLRHDAADNLSQKEEETWNFLTHASGYNPHCIFLFFLEKIAFDSTVLLDFLISSETCFLEYLVRYLKLLRKDWHQFVDVCNNFDTKHGTFQSISSVKPPHQEKQSCMTDESLQIACCEPEPQTLISLADSHNYLVFTTEQGDNEVAESNQSNSLVCTDSTSLLGSLQSLVNYDSSEDSELESDGKECLVNTKQVPLNKEVETRIRETGCSYTGDKRNTLKSEVLPLKQKESNTSSCLTCMASSDNIIPLRIMLYKCTKCLEELQKAISRLQRRNLFPYNPSALLKLLSHIEKISKNMNPQ